VIVILKLKLSLHAFSSKSCSSVPSSAVTSDDSDSEDNSTDVCKHSNSPKRQCIRPTASASQKHNKKWEKDFPWVEYDEGAFCKVCQKSVPTRTQTSQGSGSEKMRTHERSDNHKKQIEAESIVSTGEQLYITSNALEI